MNPLLFADIARDRQAELLAEAALSDRLAEHARGRASRVFGLAAGVPAIATLLVIAALSVLLIGAKRASSTTSDLSLDDVRRVLQDAGYVVEPPMHWGDQAMLLEAQAEDGRMLRAFVYRETYAAEMAHRQASTQQVGSNADSDDAGPRLLSGFGSSLWRRNVALVQSSPDIFTQLMPIEPDCFDPASSYSVDLTRPEYRVDTGVAALVDRLASASGGVHQQ